MDERASEMRFLLGESHLEADRPERALAAYATVKGGPFHDAALRGAGFAASALGRNAAAAQWFEQVLTGFPDSRFRGEAALQRGIHLLKAGEAQKAFDALSTEDAGQGPDTLYWRGRALAKLEQNERALQTYDAALRAKPGEVLANRIQVARGDALFELGRGDEAAAAYQLSGSDYALHAAAVAKLNAGEAAEAVRIARQIVASGRESAYSIEAQLTLGEGLFALTQYAPAEESFQVVARESTDPAKRARAIARMGWCRWLSGDFEAAEEHFGAVGENYPESDEADEAAFMRARAADSNEGGARAAQAYAAYLAAHPSGAHVVEAGLRYARLEPGAAGLERLQALVAAAPESDFKVQARFDLAERLAAEGRFAEARPLYAAVAGDGESDLAPAARYGLAWCLYSEGQYATAAEHLAALGADDSLGTDLNVASLELCVWAAPRRGCATRIATATRTRSTSGS
jgi:tetratricopeptide (TPR) repeat protein